MIHLEGQWMRVTISWINKMGKDELRTKIASDVQTFLFELVVDNRDKLSGFRVALAAKVLKIDPKYTKKVIDIMISLEMVKKDNKKPVYFVNPRLLWNGKDEKKYSQAVCNWESGDMWFNFQEYLHSDEFQKFLITKESQTNFYQLDPSGHHN